MKDKNKREILKEQVNLLLKETQIVISNQLIIILK